MSHCQISRVKVNNNNSMTLAFFLNWYMYMLTLDSRLERCILTTFYTLNIQVPHRVGGNQKR